MVSRALSIWMNGEYVGQWCVSDRGVHSLEYHPEWMRSEHGRPLSRSLPFVSTGQHKGQAVSAYFENLLPDNDRILERLKLRHHTRSKAAFDLLTAIGRDCVGAVQLLPSGHLPQGVRQIDRIAMTESDVERHLNEMAINTRAANAISDLRISIAGAQEKSALLYHRGQWCLPQQATPTTHILKLPLGVVGGGLDLSGSIENEWLCSRILRAFGLPVAECEVARFGQTRTLVVTRFDRQLVAHPTSPWIVRLPQEDFCQATATPPSQKYEADGGPGISRILRFLLQAREPIRDITHFMKANLVFWLLAAPDGHAKNFSLFLLPGDGYRLTPFYDVMSGWPYIGSGVGKRPYQDFKLAMGLKGKNKHYDMARVLPRHWLSELRRAGVDELWPHLLDTVDRVETVIDLVQNQLPRDFPAQIWEAVRAGMRRHQERFRSQLANL